MKTSYVKYGEILSTDIRMDASYHLSEGQEIKRVINSSPYNILSIKDVCSDIFIGNRARRVYVSNKERGIPFLSSSDILLADLDNVKNASKKYTPKVEQMLLKKGWTLITRSGTIGNTAFANAKHAQKLASEHVIRCVPNHILKQGLLYAYLASKYGYSLLTQGTFGGVIQHIEPDFVGSLPIPNFPEPFQQTVDDMVQESAHTRELAADLLKEAITLLETEIGESQYDASYRSGAITSKQISSHFKRFDAQYQIGSTELSKDIRGSKTVKIGELAKSIFVGNRGKRHYVKEGLPFLSSSDMMLFNPLKYSTPISLKTPNIQGLLVHKDDILISRSGTIGNTVIVSEILDGKAVSEHALRLVIDADKISPQYVFCYLNTQHGKRTLESLAYGSVIITLGEEFVADIDLPIIATDKINRITELIKTYQELIDKSTLLENNAVSMVESEIEKWNN